VAHLRAVIQERRASPASGNDGRANEPEPFIEAHPSPPLQLEDTGVLYRLPDRQRERAVTIENVAADDASRPERVPAPRPPAAA
jgi:hypothetical protein